MQKNGITSDVNSLFEKKGGKLDNGKYAVGKIPKKMNLLKFQYRFLKVILWEYLIVKAKLHQMQKL